MANQIIIDIGAVANDGTGDPLRTAFGYVNNNFSNVWATGVANSNIQFDGNRILTTNTNGNLVLAPNGIGKVQANVDIVPNANNTLSLGSLTRQWNTVYARNLTVAGDTTFNDLTVDGNLTVRGNTIQIGNIVTDTKTIQLANTASTANAANGSGITVGANDNIATMLYNSTSNTWTMNIGVNVTGNVTAPYFVGNGALLTGITGYSNADVSAYLASGTNTANIITTGSLSGKDISTGNVFVANGVYGEFGAFTGGSDRGLNSIQAGVSGGTFLGSDVIAQFTGNSNAYAQYNFQNINDGTQASGDYVITADNGTDSTHFLNIGLTSSTWDGSQPNSLGNRLGPNDGYLYVQDGDLVIGTSNGNIETWKFGQDGTLTAAGDIVPAVSNTQSLGNATNQWADLWVSNSTIYMNSVPITLGAGNVLTVNGEALLSNDSNTSITTSGNITADYFIGDGSQLTNLPFDASQIENGTSNVAITTANGNVTVTANSTQTWTFGTDGTTIFPTLTVTRGDRSGTLSGQALVFGDSTQEAIISTPNGTDSISSSQRFVINPGAGADGTTGEGGDIYLYAGRGGDAGGSGGDIKIRGGLAPADGTGGYLDIQGGDTDGNGTGGYVDIRGGESGSAVGGAVNLYGGYGPTDGGVVTITGGQGGTGTGGNVSITGGTGGNGLPTYGNVSIASGSSTWTFNNTGNLVLPNDGVIYETNIPFGGLSGKTIALKPYGGTDADQQLLVYPTAVADANHLHLTSGNLYNTELFLGNDNLYVKLANTGDIVINTNDTGNTAQWTFGSNGVLTVPGNISATADLSLQVSSGIPSGVYNWQGQGGWNQGFYGNLATTGGTGTGLTVDVAAGGSGYIDINQITINTPGTGYTDGDVITIDNENNLPGTFEVTVSANNWEFGGNGTLTAPGNVNTTGNVSAGNLITSGNISMDWLDVGNIGNIAVIAADVKLQITADAGNTAPYWTFNNDGTLFVPGNISGDNSAPLIVEGSGSGEGYISLPHATFGGEQVAIVNKFGLGNGIRLETNGGNIFFDDTGNLTVPGNIIMPPGTSLTGSGASPAPSISGFTSVSAETLSATGNVSGGNINTAIVSATGQIVSTASGNAATDSGQIFLNGATNNRIDWNTNGTGAPEYTTRSAGAKVVLYPSIGGSSTDYALGVEAGALWSGIPGNDGGQFFKWYGGNVPVASLSGTGVFSVTGNVTGGNIITTGNVSGNTAGYAIGYRDIPQVGFTGNTTIATTDAGKHYYSTESSNYTLTIANNASQGFQVGAAITVVNQGTGNITVAQGSGVTLYLAGNATSGNRTVSTFGMATIVKVATDTWFISGAGVA